MGSVVADHQQVEQAAARCRGGQRSLMAGQAKQSNLAGFLGGAANLERSARSNYRFPFRRFLDVVKRKSINVIGSQGAQNVAEFAPGVRGRASFELNTNRRFLALRAQLGDGLGKGIIRTAPIQEIDATLDGKQHIPYTQIRIATRGQSKPANPPIRARERGEKEW
jgi:hypothetical protein